MGIGFEVVYSPQKPIWVPTHSTTRMYVGQLVYYGNTTAAQSGVTAFPTANGADDASGHMIPYGVIVGTNNKNPVSAVVTTALNRLEYIDGVETAVAQLGRDWAGAEGMYSKGDPQPLVQIVRILPQTVLRGYFRGSATVGTTAISSVACTGTLSTTSIPLAATGGFTAVTYNATAYCVTGANAGIYRRRIDTDSGTTAMTFTTGVKAWPQTPVAGDIFKTVNVAQGYCRMATDTTYGLWIDNTAALTNYTFVNVLDINLSGAAGEEYCDFQFGIDTFLGAAITRT